MTKGSRDSVASYVKQGLETFKQDIQASTENLLSSIKSTSADKLDLRVLGKKAQSLYEQFRDRGYEPSEPEAIETGLKRKADSTADEGMLIASAQILMRDSCIAAS